MAGQAIELSNNAKFKIQNRRSLWPSALQAERLHLSTIALLRRSIPQTLEPDKSADVLKKVIFRKSYKAAKVINYNLIGTAFVRAYMVKNLLKCLYACSFLKSAQKYGGYIPPSRVIDIGSGAGTASIAWKQTFADDMAEYVQIDPSTQQTDLSSAFWDILFGDDLRIYNSKFEDFPNQPGIRLASYWLCGQDFLSFDKDYLSKIIGQEILIIDYFDVIQKFHDATLTMVSSNIHSLSIEMLPIHQKMLNEKYLNLCFLHARID